MSEQAAEVEKPWAPGNWHAAYDAMTAKLHSHSFWKRRCDGTPLDTDIPVRATQLAMEWLDVMAADRDAALEERDRLRAALLELDAMYRRIAPDDPEGLHPDLHPAWKAAKAALKAGSYPQQEE